MSVYCITAITIDYDNSCVKANGHRKHIYVSMVGVFVVLPRVNWLTFDIIFLKVNGNPNGNPNLLFIIITINYYNIYLFKVGYNLK